MDVCSFRPATQKKEVRSIKYIGIDIGKRNCYVCVMDGDGNVLEETRYANLYGEAFRYATKVKAGSVSAVLSASLRGTSG